MSRNLKISFYLYSFVLFCFFVISLVYMSRAEFMPYHAVAVNMSWSEVPTNFQTLILAGIHAIGTLLFTVASAIGVILYIPFKQDIVWAKYGVGVLSILVSFSLLFVVLYVRANTEALPPVYPLVIILSIVIVSFFISFKKEKTI